MFLLPMLRKYIAPLSGIALFSLLGALGGVAVLAAIRSVLVDSKQNGALDGHWVVLFLVLVLVIALVTTLSQMALHWLGHTFVLKMRQTLVSQVLETDLEQLQALGQGRILAMLTADVRNLTIAFVHMPVLLHSVFLSLCVLAYLAWLSLAMFASILVALVSIGAVGLLLVGRLNHYVRLLREDEDAIHQDYQAMVSGKRELTLNRNRAKVFFDDELTEHAGAYRHNIAYADSLVDITNSLSNTLVLSLVGLSMYLSVGLGWASTDVATIYALAILFLRTPMMSAVAALPVMVSANVSYKKLKDLNLPEPSDARFQNESSFSGFSTLALKDVYFGYENSDTGFKAGPFNFELKRGELVFVIGGNGSGKSTFANLLTGLYQPHQGNIFVDGTPVSEEKRNDYRSLFSAVFSDFHVFKQLLNANGERADASQVNQWLERLHMQEKVKFEEGALSSVDFSQGQKKRLALMLAALENRECLLLDEWAADQDPQFRHTFYTEILPLLSSQGKTIVAITHDDHYFDLADRVLKMDEGILHELDSSERQALNRVVKNTVSEDAHTTFLK